MGSHIHRQGFTLVLLVAALLLVSGANAFLSERARGLVSAEIQKVAAVNSDISHNLLKLQHKLQRLEERAAQVHAREPRDASQSQVLLSILLLTPDFTLNRPAYNTTCTSVGNGTVHLPEQLLSLFTPQAFFRLTPGDYDCVVDQPGYYRFYDRISINATSYSNFRYFHLVPVTNGVTFVYNFLHSGTAGMFFPNMTFPRGAFKFRSATTMSIVETEVDDVNYGLIGKIPARYRWSPWYSELVLATSGVYHYSMEAMHLDPIPPIYPNGLDWGYNFLNGTQRLAIFAGKDQQNGFKGFYSSRVVDAKSWHVGSLIVSNPSEGCARYSWHSVDAYSYRYGINPDSPAAGSGELLVEECFDITDEALRCAAQVYEEDAPTSTCGAFGDPHVVMFNGTGVTCGRDTAITLVDNKWFSLVGVTTLVDENPATVLRSVTFTYKGSCNPSTLTFNDLGDLMASSIPNSPIAQRHQVRLTGNNIYVDAIRLRVQIRSIVDNSNWPALVFGISMPTSLIQDSTGVCVGSCPDGTLVSIDAGKRKRDPALAAMALAACEDAGLSDNSFEAQACLFDVETTGDATYAEVASTSKVVKRDVSTHWANNRSSSASFVSASLVIIAFAAISMLFLL